MSHGASNSKESEEECPAYFSSAQPGSKKGLEDDFHFRSINFSLGLCYKEDVPANLEHGSFPGWLGKKEKAKAC